MTLEEEDMEVMEDTKVEEDTESEEGSRKIWSRLGVDRLL
jgi:hypothetical protein